MSLPEPKLDRRILAALRELKAVRLRDEAPVADEHLLDQVHLRVLTGAGIIDLLASSAWQIGRGIGMT